jgi:hypothetical protein
MNNETPCIYPFSGCIAAHSLSPRHGSIPFSAFARAASANRCSEERRGSGTGRVGSVARPARKARGYSPK